MKIPIEMREIMNEIAELLAAHYTDVCDYDFVALRNKVHRYMDTLSEEQRKFFEEESAIELLDILSNDIVDRYAARGKELKPEKKNPMPFKMRAMCQEFDRIEVDEDFLEFEERMLEYCETLTPEESDILTENGIMEMLSMICDGIRYERDPLYYEKRDKKRIEEGLAVMYTE